MRLRGRNFGLLVGLGLTLGAQHAWAFKTKTHVATANETLDQLETVITEDSATNTLVFEVNGQLLSVPITAKQAYQAIRRHPEAFRAGAVGPDGYVDPISGQMFAHSNQSKFLRGAVKDITGVEPHDHATHVGMEQRIGLSELRSIDFVTAMLQFFATGYAFPGGDDERQQALAFIVGYLSHGIGDGFSHTWVNELSGGAWDIEEGTGIFGSATEEIKHVAVERFLDALLPSDLIDGATPRERLTVRAPVAFLDAFYASPVSAAVVPSTAARDSSPEGFANFFARIDMFRGGPVTSFFNAQRQLGASSKGWSRIGPVFDLAETYQETEFVSTLLDVADYPAQLLSYLAAAVPAVDPFSAVTGGAVDCYSPIGGGGGGATDLEKLRAVWRYLGTMNDRLGVYEEKAEIVRRNWLLLAECTVQNVTNVDCSELDPANPAAVLDACTTLANAPWEDEGTPNGLYRGSLRESASPEIADFLNGIRDAFRGGADNDVENAGGHYSMGENLRRMLSYLSGPGMVLDDFAEVIIPQGTDEDGVSILDRYNQFCAQVRDEAYENCLDLHLAPIAATGRQVACLAEHTVCIAEAQQGCLTDACNAFCTPPMPCGNLCGSSGNGCNSTCGNLFCWEVCDPIFDLGCTTVCEILTYNTCRGVCAIFSDEEDSCFDTATASAECVAKQIECDIDNLVSTVTLDNFAEEILTPLRQTCDRVDDAIAFVEDCLSTPDAFEACLCDMVGPTQCAQLRAAKDEAERIVGIADSVQAEVCSRPPHSFVNVAFLFEDMLADPAYLDSIDAALPAKFAEVNALPPGDDRTNKLNALNRFQDLVNDARAFRAGNPIPLLMDPDDPTTVVSDAYQLGLIPDFLGPTARQIVREVGPDMRSTFDPFFNAVQGMKLAPMLGRDDLESLFVAEGADESRLPWSQAGLFSAACSTTSINPYCDVIASFDDPNCLNCEGDDLAPRPPFGWLPGRGLVAWNDYDPTGATPRNVLTNFTLASSQSAYDALYKKVFRVPAAVPGWAGFDDPDHPWTVGQGSAGLSQNPDNKTEGSASLQVDGCGFIVLDSPGFKTADWGVTSDQMAMDIFIPAAQSNPSWVGQAQFLVTVRGANIFNAFVDQEDLTSLPRDQWSTVTFDIPGDLRSALASDFSNAQFHVVLNIASCLAPVLVDNLRFVGEVVERDVFHVRPSSIYGVSSSAFMTFDDAADWSSTAPVFGSTDYRVEGAASVGIVPTWWTTVTSRAFSTAELVNVTDRINLDLYLPDSPPVPDLWQSNVQLFLTCGPLVNHPLGPADIRRGFLGEFNSLEFEVPPDVQQILSGASGTFSGCSVQVALSVGNPEDAVFYLDNMGFIQP